MAYRKPVSVSLPPPLDEKLTRLAKKRHQTKSEFVRAALTRYIEDQEEWDTRWKRLRAVGSQSMKEAGIGSEDELQAMLYEMRHGRPRGRRSDARPASRR